MARGAMVLARASERVLYLLSFKVVCVLGKGRRDKPVKLTCTVGYSCTCISVFNQSSVSDF